MLEGWNVEKGEDIRRIQSNHESTKTGKHEIRGYVLVRMQETDKENGWNG